MGAIRVINGAVLKKIALLLLYALTIANGFVLMAACIGIYANEAMAVQMSRTPADVLARAAYTLTWSLLLQAAFLVITRHFSTTAWPTLGSYALTFVSIGCYYWLIEAP